MLFFLLARTIVHWLEVDRKLAVCSEYKDYFDFTYPSGKPIAFAKETVEREPKVFRKRFYEIERKQAPRSIFNIIFTKRLKRVSVNSRFALCEYFPLIQTVSTVSKGHFGTIVLEV